MKRCTSYKTSNNFFFFSISKRRISFYVHCIHIYSRKKFFYFLLSIKKLFYAVIRCIGRETGTLSTSKIKFSRTHIYICIIYTKLYWCLKKFEHLYAKLLPSRIFFTKKVSAYNLGKKSVKKKSFQPKIQENQLLISA